MSSASSYPRCAVELSPSPGLSFLVLVVLAAAAASPWLAGMPFLLALFISLGAIPAVCSAWRWARGSLSRVVWLPDGRWQLLERSGGSHDDARLLPGTWTGSSLLALRWRCEECGRTFRAALLNDNCDRESLRRLRVRINVTRDDLLFGKNQESGASDQ